MAVGLTNGVYGNMEFPEYKFKEFPKTLYIEGGKRVKVNSLREELKVRGDSKVVEGSRDPVQQERDDAINALREREAKIAALEAELAQRKGQAIVAETTGLGEAPKAASVPAPQAPQAAKNKLVA